MQAGDKETRNKTLTFSRWDVLCQTPLTAVKAGGPPDSGIRFSGFHGFTETSPPKVNRDEEVPVSSETGVRRPHADHTGGKSVLCRSEHEMRRCRTAERRGVAAQRRMKVVCLGDASRLPSLIFLSSVFSFHGSRPTGMLTEGIVFTTPSD